MHDVIQIRHQPVTAPKILLEIHTSHVIVIEATYPQFPASFVNQVRVVQILTVMLAITGKLVTVRKVLVETLILVVSLKVASVVQILVVHRPCAKWILVACPFVYVLKVL